MDPSSSFSEHFDEDPDFIAALVAGAADVLPRPHLGKRPRDDGNAVKVDVLRASPRQAQDEKEIYGASSFGGISTFMHRKRMKLQIQNENIATDGLAPIFKNIEIYVNGRTNPPFQEIRELVVSRGGVFHAILDRKGLVTHIITEQLTPQKIKEFARMKVVTPRWIIDSIQINRLLPWKDYMFRVSEGHRVDGPSMNKPIPTQHTIASSLSIPQSPSTSHMAPPPPPPPPPQQRTHLLPESGGAGPSKPIMPSALSNDKPMEISLPDSETETQAIASITDAYDQPHPQSKLVSDPNWRLKHTAAAPGFVTNYFRRSRLHWLSTWKSDLKLLVRNARKGNVAKTGQSDAISMRGGELKTLNALSRDKGKGKERERVIMHCDFDSFFVSAGLVDRPELRGKPVAVCHAGSTGGKDKESTSEIASASYEARKFGVKNGMFLGQARELCPEIRTIPYDFERYKDLSMKFYNVLISYADDIQVISVDEAIIDVSFMVHDMAQQGRLNPHVDVDYAFLLAEQIRNSIRQATACEVSVGIAHNVLLARVATRHAKPAGAFRLSTSPSLIQDHLDPLSIDKLWGVGYKTVAKIEGKWSASTIGDIRKKTNLGSFQSLLGPVQGKKIWDSMHGIDEGALKIEETKKSLSVEVNYGIRLEDALETQRFISEFAIEVAQRLDADSLKGRVLTLNVMTRKADAPIETFKLLGHGSCDTHSYSTPIGGPNGGPTSDATLISHHAWKLLKEHHGSNIPDLRGVGITIAKLEGTEKEVEEGQSKLPFRRPGPLPKRATSINDAPIIILDSPPTTPTKPKSDRTKAAINVDRITKQLAPRTRTLSPNKKKYSIFEKRAVTPITDAELRALNLDPETFHAIPEDIQREQLNNARNVRRKEMKDAAAAKQKRQNSAIRNSRSRSRSRSVSAVPFGESGMGRVKASWVMPPLLKKVSSTEDVQGLVSKWVGACAESGPGESATKSVCDFLLRCLDKHGLGDCGLERVVAIMKWWLWLCRSRWGDWEKEEEEDPDEEDVVEISVPHQWWRAFRSVKARLDQVVQQRFGGNLSLK